MAKRDGTSRRGFLKKITVAGVAMALPDPCSRAKNVAVAATVPQSESLPSRTLGTGKAAFAVSALGFGVMGMTYNRSEHPDRKQCIRLLHEAVERGVTLFDTAVIYGPLTNEIGRAHV